MNRIVLYVLVLTVLSGCLSQPELNGPTPAEPAAFFSGPSPQPTACGGSCAFVGSKHSNVYHVPHCSYARRIHAENCVCFRSRDEAVAAGYRKARGC